MAKAKRTNEFNCADTYERILEILEDYWLDEDDELLVVVDMGFLKADGQKQFKTIIWRSPDYEPINQTETSIISASDLCKADLEYFSAEKFIDEIHAEDYRKKED